MNNLEQKLAKMSDEELVQEFLVLDNYDYFEIMFLRYEIKKRKNRIKNYEILQNSIEENLKNRKDRIKKLLKNIMIFLFIIVGIVTLVGALYIFDLIMKMIPGGWTPIFK